MERAAYALKKLSRLEKGEDFTRIEIFGDPLNEGRRHFIDNVMKELRTRHLIRKESNGPGAYYTIIGEAEMFQFIFEDKKKLEFLCWPGGTQPLKNEDYGQWEGPWDSEETTPSPAAEEGGAALALPTDVPEPEPADEDVEHPKTFEELARLTVAIAKNQVALNEKIDSAYVLLRRLANEWGLKDVDT